MALYAADSPEWIAACLATIRAGAAVLPLDVQMPEDTQARVLADSGARLVFTTADKLDKLSRAGGDISTWLLDVPADGARSRRALMTAPDAANSLPAVTPEDAAALFYTSGTTGLPKGVPLTHANLAFQIDAIRATGLLDPADRVALPLPLHHVYPFVMGVLLPVALGVPIVIPQALTGPQVVRALKEGEATVMIGVPRLYAALYAGIEARVAARGRRAVVVFKAMLALSTWMRRRLGLRWGRRLFAPLHRQLAPRLHLLACAAAAPWSRNSPGVWRGWAGVWPSGTG